MFFEEENPCLLVDVYDILISFLWLPQNVHHHNSGPIDLDIEQDPVEAVDTHIDEVLDICTYCQVELMKVEGLT